MATAEQAEGTNGVTSASDLRSQILASIPADDAPAKAPAEPAEPADEEPTDEDAPVDDDAAPEEDADSDEDTDVDEDEDSDLAEGTPPPDAKAAKGLDVVRRAEKRHREKMDADRAEFAAEKQKHADAIAKVAEFEAAAKRVKYDPAAVLKLLGVTEDDFELAAHAIYAESKSGAADPKRKEAAAQRLRDREKDDKQTALEKEVADMRAERLRDKQEATQREQAAQYIQQLNGAASAKFPLVAKLLELDPQDAADGLSAAYERLVKASGKEPTPAAVVAELDRKERTRLKRLGVDPDTIAKAKTVAKPGAKTIAKVAPVAKGAKVPTREEILAQLAADGEADLH